MPIYQHWQVCLLIFQFFLSMPAFPNDPQPSPPDDNDDSSFPGIASFSRWWPWPWPLQWYTGFRCFVGGSGIIGELFHCHSASLRVYWLFIASHATSTHFKSTLLPLTMPPRHHFVHHPYCKPFHPQCSLEHSHLCPTPQQLVQRQSFDFVTLCLQGSSGMLSSVYMSIPLMLMWLHCLGCLGIWFQTLKVSFAYSASFNAFWQFSVIFRFFLSLYTTLCVVNAPETLSKVSASPVHHISAPVGELDDFHLFLGTMLMSSRVVCVSFWMLYPWLHMPAMFKRFLSPCGSSVCNIAPLPDKSTGSSHFEVFQCICRYSWAICNALCVCAHVQHVRLASQLLWNVWLCPSSRYIQINWHFYRLCITMPHVHIFSVYAWILSTSNRYVHDLALLLGEFGDFVSAARVYWFGSHCISIGHFYTVSDTWYILVLLWCIQVSKAICCCYVTSCFSCIQFCVCAITIASSNHLTSL